VIRRPVVIGAVAAAVLVGAVQGLSYWLGGGSGAASASVGTLAAAAISAPASSTGTVPLAWQTQAAMTPSGAVSGVTYTVERRLGAGSFAPVSAGPCAGALPYGTASCADAPDVSGLYRYRVVARFSTAWTAVSNEVAVNVVVDTSAPATTLSFPLDGTTYSALGFSVGCLPTGLCGTATDATGVAVVRVSVQKAGGGYWTGTSFSGFSELFLDANLLVPGGTSTNWSFPLSATLDGRYTVHVQARDSIGNDSSPVTTSTATFVVDVVGPTTTLATTPASPDGANGWFRQSSVGFTLSATDPSPGSGVSEVEYALDGGAAQTYSGAGSIAVQGDHTLAYWAVDSLGNAEAPHSVHLKLDNVSPVTTIAFAPSTPNGSNGWYTSAPTFSLSATDASSGVATTYYRVDGGSATAYVGPVAVPEGQHTVSYWSSDSAGNTETTHTTSTVKVDTVRPSTTISTTPGAPDGSNGWFKQASVQFSLNGSDATSGISSRRYTVDGGAAQTYSTPVTVTGQGVHTVAYWSLDNAGNVEATNTTTIRLDNVVPTTTLTTSPATADGSNGWFRQTSVGVTLAANDAISGVGSTSYTVDGGATQAYAGVFAVATPGDHTITYWSTDNAGNVESVRTAHVKLDAAAPSTALATTPPSPDGANGWFTSTVSFALSANDAASGVASRFYKLDGGATQTYSSGVALTQGDHTIEYWSTDNAGNVEGHSTTHVKLDTVSPVTTLATTPGSPDGANGWFKQASVSFTLAATDATSGVGTRLYTIDGGAQQTYTAPVAVATQGDHVVTYWSVDNAGNAETVHTTHVKLDNVAPTVAVTLTAAGSAALGGTTVVYRQNDGTAANRTFRLRATVSDGTSQPASASFPAIGGTGWTHAAEGPVTTPGSGVYESSAFTWTTSASNPPAYTVSVADQAGNTGSQGITFASDVTPPANAFALGASPVGALLSGSTVYFRSGAAGSFTLVDTTTDAGSGPASVAFPAIATTGWTHGAETVTSGTGTAPTIAYTSSQYSWTAGAGTPLAGPRTFTATDRVGNASTTVLDFIPDNAGPAGGALTVNGTAASAAGTSSVDPDGSFTIGTRTDYSDAGAGLASSVLTRETATLAADGTTCGTFGSPATISGTPPQTGLAEGCYRYTLTGADRLGNTSSITTTVKVDTTSPTVTLTSVQDGPGQHKIVFGTTTELTGTITITIRRYLFGFLLVDTSSYTVTLASPWSFETGNVGGLSTYTAQAQQTDAAGNTSALSNILTFSGN
jgi:hypothetical protein